MSFRIAGFVSFIVLTFCCVAVLNAQSTLSLPELLKMRSEAKTDLPQITGKTVPLDSPVDPAEYYVGPGDLLALNIWSSAPIEHRLFVTPEAALLIPNVGVVDVRDQTLESVKRIVTRIAGRKYPNSEITVTLVAPRAIIVQITGDVLNETKFELNSLQRVDNLIAMANQPPEGVMDARFLMNEVLRTRASSSQRGIVVMRSNGKRHRVDLQKYRATGETKYNPYLREGDQVFVPSKQEMKTSIGVFGAVRLSGSFEFVSGDSLTDLIWMGLGFKSTADSTSAEFSRLSPDGRTMEKLTVNPAAMLAHQQPNIALRPGDRLLVKENFDFRVSNIVAIDGEVHSPGRFPITMQSTKLSEVIKAAGGLTEEANISAATLTRERISPQGAPEEIAHEQLLSSRSNLGLQDTAYYLTETALRLKGELVSVDFYRLLVLNDSTQDVTLRNHDRIVVPRRSRTVYVFGQVLSPGHVEFIEGKDYSYYVQKARGYAQDAREGDVKIIKGNTRVWLEPGETTIEDGDFIWIPKEKQYPFAYHLNIWAQVAGIIGTVATVALLINNLTK